MNQDRDREALPEDCHELMVTYRDNYPQFHEPVFTYEGTRWVGIEAFEPGSFLPWRLLRQLRADAEYRKREGYFAGWRAEDEHTARFLFVDARVDPAVNASWQPVSPPPARYVSEEPIYASPIAQAMREGRDRW